VPNTNETRVTFSETSPQGHHEPLHAGFKLRLLETSHNSAYKGPIGTPDVSHAPFIPPMLCSRLERLERLTERRYIAEPKLDGQRAQVHIRDGRTVAGCGRPGRDLLRHPGMALLRGMTWPCRAPRSTARHVREMGTRASTQSLRSAGEGR